MIDIEEDDIEESHPTTSDPKTLTQVIYNLENRRDACLETAENHRYRSHCIRAQQEADWLTTIIEQLFRLIDDEELINSLEVMESKWHQRQVALQEVQGDHTEQDRLPV